MTPDFETTSRKNGTAYLFPGQGAQNVGMGVELYEHSVASRSVFDEVDKALQRPLTKILFNGPEDEIRETINAQPAIMAVSLACYRALEEQLGTKDMPHPTLLAGHSLGEYTTLAIAGVLSISETAQLVQERGRLMQSACDQKPGAMAAVMGLDQMVMEEISRETGTYISNVNTPLQIVISGERMAVARALDLATARGAKKVIQLRVAGAFHSALMEPAKSGLVNAVKHLQFKDPEIPIVANCTGTPLTKADDVKSELVSQISTCVQWKQSIEYMVGAGVSRFIELGPGKALSSMVRRIAPSAETVSAADMESISRFSKN